MSIDKQEKEIAELRPVCSLLGISEKDVLKDESPDFRLNYKGKLVGIEMTNCFASMIDGEGNIARSESIVAHVLDKYKQRLISNGEKNAIVYVCFNIDNLMKETKSERVIVKRCLDEIDIFLKYRIPFENAPNDYSLLDRALKNRAFDLLFIESASINHLGKGINVIRRFNARYVLNIESKHINACLESKEPKLFDYRKSSKNKDIDEYWLIITVPFQEYYWIEEIEKHPPIIESSFDKVYIVKYNTVICLR